MNARDGLIQIKERLVERDARTETLRLVDTMIKRASTPGADKAQASLGQLVTLLARTPVANDNVVVYGELMDLKEDFDRVAARRKEASAAEEAKPLPKSKKYYKRLKEQEAKKAESGF